MRAPLCHCLLELAHIKHHPTHTITLLLTHPMTPPNKRIFAVFIEFLGGYAYALVIASITSAVTHSDMNSLKVSEQLDAVRSFVHNRE